MYQSNFRNKPASLHSWRKLVQDSLSSSASEGKRRKSKVLHCCWPESHPVQGSDLSGCFPSFSKLTTSSVCRMMQRFLHSTLSYKQPCTTLRLEMQRKPHKSRNWEHDYCKSIKMKPVQNGWSTVGKTVTMFTCFVCKMHHKLFSPLSIFKISAWIISS